MCIPKCICFFLMRGKISQGVLQDNRLEKVQGIFKPQNECFAIKDLQLDQLDLLGLYFEF